MGYPAFQREYEDLKGCKLRLAALLLVPRSLDPFGRLEGPGIMRPAVSNQGAFLWHICVICVGTAADVDFWLNIAAYTILFAVFSGFNNNGGEYICGLATRFQDLYAVLRPWPVLIIVDETAEDACY